MDDNRLLTNKIFKQKINELVGADVVELEAANDDLALNCKVFETGMDAIKTIIPEPGPTPTPTGEIKIITYILHSYDEKESEYTCEKTFNEISELLKNNVVLFYIKNIHSDDSGVHDNGYIGSFNLVGKTNLKISLSYCIRQDNNISIATLTHTNEDEITFTRN